MQKTKQKILIGVSVMLALLLLVLFPIIFVAGLLTNTVAFLNPTHVNNAQGDPHVLALEAVSAKYHTENSIDVYLIKVVDLFAHDKITDDRAEIERFIIQYFLLEKEREVEVTETEDGEEKVKKKKEKYYVYTTFYELVSVVRNPPFSFGDGAISAIVNLSMAGVVLGDGTNIGDTTGQGPGGPQGTLNGRYPAPVQGGVITCGYGWRVNPITGKTELHPALDIQGEHHAPVTSIADGVVESVSTAVSPYGNFVVIRHELPNETMWSKYGHLSRIDVAVGRQVTQGEQIGVEGGNPGDPNPGWSTGHHVHLEIWTKEGHVNPADYIY